MMSRRSALARLSAAAAAAVPARAMAALPPLPAKRIAYGAHASQWGEL
jgi:hypothetical protein